jgi:hypothetical protein
MVQERRTHRNVTGARRLSPNGPLIPFMGVEYCSVEWLFGTPPHEAGEEPLGRFLAHVCSF